LGNFVNDIKYNSDYAFKIVSLLNNESHTNGFVHKSNIGNLKFKDLEHGMVLEDGTVIKKLHKDAISNKESFYFLHLAKTSGMSLKEELKDVFKNEQMFINNIQHLNELEMLNSKFISGHFAMYPVNLFKKNNKRIHSITITRNPLDRAISFFVFRYKVHDSMLNKKTEGLNSKYFDNFLYDPNNLDFINNFQTRSITSNLDLEMSNLWSNKYINGSIDRFQLTGRMAANCNFIERKSNGSLWRDSLHEFDIIGTMDSRELFLNQLSRILEKNQYMSNFKNIKNNASDFEIEQIKKMLTKDQINRVIELNNYDFEMYDFLMTNKGVFKC
jgi:hypothetical protein